MAATKEQQRRYQAALRRVLACLRAEQPELYERWLREALALSPDVAAALPERLELECAGCGRTFPWGRRRKYCEDCGRRAAVNDAASRYRQRKKAKQFEEMGGHSPKAKTVDIKQVVSRLPKGPAPGASKKPPSEG